MTKAALECLRGYHRPDAMIKSLTSVLFGQEYEAVDRLSGNLQGSLEGIESLVSLMIGTICTTPQGQTNLKPLRSLLEKVAFMKESEGASSSAATPQDVAVAMGGMMT